MQGTSLTPAISCGLISALPLKNTSKLCSSEVQFLSNVGQCLTKVKNLFLSIWEKRIVNMSGLLLVRQSRYYLTAAIALVRNAMKK